LARELSRHQEGKKRTNGFFIFPNWALRWYTDQMKPSGKARGSIQSFQPKKVKGEIFQQPLNRWHGIFSFQIGNDPSCIQDLLDQGRKWLSFDHFSRGEIMDYTQIFQL